MKILRSVTLMVMLAAPMTVGCGGSTKEPTVPENPKPAPEIGTTDISAGGGSTNTRSAP